ncbi:protein Brevis radix-like 1 isoform X2 [Wolffia australiana]
MLTCLACSKQLAGAIEPDSARERDPIKSLTAQVKDMVLRLSGTRRRCKAPTTDDDDGTREESVKNETAPRQGFSCREDPSFNFPVEEEDADSKEWTALVEPGVFITFVSLPGGGNDLKRIRFKKEMFDKRQAQRWWGENIDRLMELYNVQSFTRPAISTPTRSTNSSIPPPPPVHATAATSSRSDGSPPGPAEAPEWVEEDEPGVLVTVRRLPDGSRELRRVKFSRQLFSEARAKQWWEENWERVQARHTE